MFNIESSWKPVAFKEWKVVCDAIAAGEQSVILRKGGIAEGKSGFQWNHDRFFLFPTGFHQQSELVRCDELGEPRKPGHLENQNSIELALFVETIKTGVLTDWDAICELEPYHVWTRDCIKARFEWGDQSGISYAIVKSSVLSDPWILPDRKSFGGCRSWVDLPSEENGGFVERLQGSCPVEPKCGLPSF